MRSYTLPIAAVALFATVAHVQAAIDGTIKRDISELSSMERMLIRLTHPELYNAWFSKSRPESRVPVDHLLRDLLTFDIPTLALQLSKSGDVILPSVRHTYNWYFCYLGICAGYTQQFDYREPELRNANLTRLNTKINATNVEVDFLIPDLQILNEKYLLTDEDLINGDIEISRGRTSIIKNYSLKLSANLGYVPNVGIQVSNVAMNFGVDSFLTRTDNVTVIYPNGTVEDKGGWESDMAEYFNSEWVRIGADVTADAETWLNCYLSNGRNGNAKCEELLNDNWEIQNFAQLLQSIGLGIQRSRQEELAKTAVAEIKKEYPRFLPGFLVPTISSALLDIPTLFLQLGKIYGGSDERTFSGYPLSYEYDRENCTLGVCRNVQEHITVPSFSLQGLSTNRVQLDFQPTNFTISLKVPNASLVSERFQREITDLESGYREIYLGLQLSIGNAAFAISGDYEFKDGVGIRVSNLGLTLLLGELQLRVPYYFTVDNGVESEIQEYKLDFAPHLMETWRGVDEDGVSFERKYEEYIQTEINAFLSNSGSIQNL